MDIASLTLDLLKDTLKILKKGADYKSTRKLLESTIKDLSPMVERIEQSMKEMDLPAEYIEKLKEKLTAIIKALEKYKIRGWKVILAPIYQSKLAAKIDELERFISVPTQIHMEELLMKILSAVSSLDQHLRIQTDSAQETYNHKTPILKRNLDERFSQFTVGLDGPMNELKNNLLHGHKQALNLYGLTGSGKTTLAKKLCVALQLQGKFKNKIIFEKLGSQIQTDEAIKRLEEALSIYGNNAVLLVLDDIWPDSKNIVEKLKQVISPDSRILMTSRVQITTADTQYPMKPLSNEDAEKLFRHLVEPSEIDFDDQETLDVLRQIVRGCKGLPLAIEFIGRELQGKRIEELQEVLFKWSEGHSTLDSNAELLAHLQDSLHLLVDEPMRERFMDLGLFPEDQRIPLTTLIDMWTELGVLKKPWNLHGKMIINKLTDMNMAAGIQVRRKVGSEVDNYYNNHFLVQHEFFRELAIHMSREPSQNGKRLIIDMNGSQRPTWWPLNQQSLASRILSISTTDQNMIPDWFNIQPDVAEVLVLNLKTKEYSLPEFIKEMENLKVLVVTNYGFHPNELRNLELLGSLWSLKRIRLQKVSVPSLCDLKNVHKLSFYMCEVKKAFEDSSIEFSKAMPKLEDLNIEYCKDLVELPTGFCKIMTLKNLNISSCHKFTGLPEEIEKLENLELLRISYCANFKEMPESISQLENLKFLDISYCIALGKLPHNIGKLRNLAKLCMSGCQIRELPNSVLELTNLRSVICDEYIYPSWEVINSCLFNLRIKTAAMDISLNWLSSGFFL